MSCVPTTRRQQPKATAICFVRHGTTATTGKVLPGRARGLHLSDQGRTEAARAADALAGLPVRAVYSSPLERTRETAAVIGERLGLPVTIERSLQECDFGEWTGAELAKLAKLPEWSTVQRWPSGFRFPGGESFLELESRLAASVDKLCRAHPGELVVAVSHADCIKALLATALGTHLDLFQRIVVAPCSISAVVYGHGGPTVLCTNSNTAPAALAPPTATNGARARGRRR